MSEIYKDPKFIAMLVIFLVLAGGILFYPVYSGLVLIAAVITFGAFCLFIKESNIKLTGLVLMVMLAIANIGVNGMSFGIDFSGGTRIPIVLDHAVDEDTMAEMVSAIKKRTSEFGLTEVKVYALGNNQINVEIPSSDEERINRIQEILSQQGVYLGIVDGKVAVSGDNIYSTSIAPARPEQLPPSAAWGVSFAVDTDGAQQFADAAKGKADYPVYMYLDRPMDADIFFMDMQIREGMLNDSGYKETRGALDDAFLLDDESAGYPNATINVYVIEELDLGNLSAEPRTNNTVAIISETAPQEYRTALENAGYLVEEFPGEEMTPGFMRTSTGVLVVNMLESVGLLSSPVLSSEVASGSLSYHYQITGGVTTTDPALKAQEAAEKQKSIISILKGGSLPVGISLGSVTTLPASLGEEFLHMSLIGIVIALVVISLFIGIRYMNIKTALPIVLISMAELVILLSILGSFTIDLAAMAGIIAAIGVGVDAQIVITDELLKKDQRSTHEKTDHAFTIIRTNVTVAALSMLPLLFSGLVEVIGFAISTIMGAILGYLLTRPAYAVIIEKVLGVKEEK